MSRQMNLVAYLMSGPTANHHGTWKHPASENRVMDPAFWETLARTLEAGKFDALFFADALTLYSQIMTEGGGPIAMLDPVPLVAILARATSHIGLGLTVSTSFVPPYAIARQLQTLDVLSGGRVAWNVVTSVTNQAARMFGQDALPPRDQRYDRAEEVLRLCLEFWNSWSDGAYLAEKATGRYLDRSKIADVDFHGKYVSATGAFPVPPSPQKHPVIMQAGSSSRGRDLAAATAELVFTYQNSLADMKAFYKDMKDRTVKAGRKPSSCAILVSVDPIIGETESIAREKKDYVNSLVDYRLGLALMTTHTGFDFSGLPLDQKLTDLEGEGGSRGVRDVIMQGASAGNMTLREIAVSYATSVMCPQVVGTAESVADQLQTLFEEEGCDGFIVMPTEMPGTFETFTRSVVPILQHRGLFRSEYPGSTLRQTIQSVNPA